jgi:4-amino-4-deoxy-L-arabinose transferase-like glycosyltransferase
MSHRRLRTYLAVGAILALALGLRIAEVQTTSYRLTNDGFLYMRLGKEITQSGDYSARDRGAGGTKGPTAYFPPLFPYFLAGVESISGQSNPRNTAIHPTRISQAVLGTVTVAMIGLVGFEAFGATVALVALAIAAVYPVLIELSGAIVAENLSTALILAASWAALRARRAHRALLWVLLTGALAGLATLTHENSAVIVLPLTAAAWAPPRRSWRSARAPALLLVAAVATVAPWTIRNAIVMHDFIPVADENGITLVGT